MRKLKGYIFNLSIHISLFDPTSVLRAYSANDHPLTRTRFCFSQLICITLLTEEFCLQKTRTATGQLIKANESRENITYISTVAIFKLETEFVKVTSSF